MSRKNKVAIDQVDEGLLKTRQMIEKAISKKKARWAVACIILILIVVIIDIALCSNKGTVWATLITIGAIVGIIKLLMFAYEDVEDLKKKLEQYDNQLKKY